MRYSYEYKLECIELYRKGIWPETPEGKTKWMLPVMYRIASMCPGFWVHINFLTNILNVFYFFKIVSL